MPQVWLKLALTDGFCEFDTALFWKADIEEHNIKVLFEELLGCFGRVRCKRGLIAHLLQQVMDHTAVVVIVFAEENAEWMFLRKVSADSIDLSLCAA